MLTQWLQSFLDTMTLVFSIPQSVGLQGSPPIHTCIQSLAYMTDIHELPDTFQTLHNDKSLLTNNKPSTRLFTNPRDVNTRCRIFNWVCSFQLAVIPSSGYMNKVTQNWRNGPAIKGQQKVSNATWGTSWNINTGGWKDSSVLRVLTETVRLVTKKRHGTLKGSVWPW